MLVILSALLLTRSNVAPPALTEQTFAAVRGHASPTQQDLAFQGIDWKTSVFEGLLQAQREDKPMVMWMYFGDPRGRC
jgi:hypothetical protein